MYVMKFSVEVILLLSLFGRLGEKMIQSIYQFLTNIFFAILEILIISRRIK